eukprot:c6016_g1_i1.p1 GENE.c6016_g1_i1~~c6016_g1_i1.p1  ORF type:complete len:265 (-),score=73.89 c6016_g1_i1:84-878(-)
MARNEEKANAMLNRFIAMKTEERTGGDRRPHMASLCDNLVRAEKWRMDIVREVGKKVSLIQTATWGEFRIRELNDEINRLLREKFHWERRITELGGPDYKLVPTRDQEGVELPDSGGYKYFGAARELPGVKELFEKAEAEAAAKRNRRELYDGIDPAYYGYRDEDDGLLLPAEAAAEKKARDAAVARWHENAQKRLRTTEGKSGAYNDADIETRSYIAHVPLPNQDDITRVVLEKKKKELLAKYASDDLLKEAEEAKRLLHIQK